MKLKSIFTLLLLNAIFTSLFSQSITNVQARAEGNTVVVSYQLYTTTPVEISLYISENGGRTFSSPLKNLSGDVGIGIQQGSKRIVWDLLNEKEFLHNSNMVFRVKAVSPFGTFRDPRDGKTYKTVKIVNQVWMAENLAYKPSSGNYWAYDKKNINVDKYGYLYDWQTAKNVCPTGWHLPSYAEWTQLIDFVGSNPSIKLKAKSGWSSNGNGTDDYGFKALPGGCRLKGGGFGGVGGDGYWWSSTERNSIDAWTRNLTSDGSDVYWQDPNKHFGFSVRCLKDRL